MLHGHKERVNCVRWMTWRSEHAQSIYAKVTPLELVSGSADNDVIVWRQSTESKEVDIYDLIQMIDTYVDDIIITS